MVDTFLQVHVLHYILYSVWKILERSILMDAIAGFQTKELILLQRH